MVGSGHVPTEETSACISISYHQGTLTPGAFLWLQIEVLIAMAIQSSMLTQSARQFCAQNQRATRD